MRGQSRSDAGSTPRQQGNHTHSSVLATREPVSATGACAARRQIQKGLAAGGFDPGGADGLFGPRTRAAIRRARRRTVGRRRRGRAWAERRRRAPPALGSPAQAAAAFGTAAADARRRPGEVFRDCAECPEMVVLPRGDLAMGRYEVTVGEYRAFASATGGGAGDGCSTYGDGDSWRNPGFPRLVWLQCRGPVGNVAERTTDCWEAHNASNVANRSSRPSALSGRDHGRHGRPRLRAGRPPRRRGRLRTADGRTLRGNAASGVLGVRVRSRLPSGVSVGLVDRESLNLELGIDAQRREARCQAVRATASSDAPA